MNEKVWDAPNDVIKMVPKFLTVFCVHSIAVEAGESLSGKVVLDVETEVDPENLYIRLFGREKCEIHGDNATS